MPIPGSPKRKSSATVHRATSEAVLKEWAKASREHKKRKPARPRRRPEFALKREAELRGAAKRFPGLSEELQLRIAMRKITIRKAGFLVHMMLDGKGFNRWFPGLSDESLFEAMEFRDEAERIFGDGTRNAIPAQVLSHLGLAARVPGVFRKVPERSYGVFYTDEQGKERSRTFSFRHVPEADAYASAIAFREQVIAAGG